MQTPYGCITGKFDGCFNLAIYRRLPNLKLPNLNFLVDTTSLYSIALHSPNNHQIFQLYSTSTFLITRLTEVIAMVAQLT